MDLKADLKLILGEDIADVVKFASDELETIEEDVELPLNQSEVQVELEDSGEEISGPLEDPSVISVSDSPRSSVITIDDTIIHQKSTGKKKKKKNSLGADCKNQNLTSKSTKRKLSFSGEGSIRKKLKKTEQILSGKKLKKNNKKTENIKLISDDSVICLEDDSFVAQGNSNTTTLSKGRCTNSTNEPVFLSLDVTSEKENAGPSKKKKVLPAKLGSVKKGRYWQTESQLNVSKSTKKNLKSKKKLVKKRKNKR